MTLDAPARVRLETRVWLWPSGPDPSRVHSPVGIVTGDRGTLLIDGGNSLEHAARIRQWLLDSGSPPLRGVILTHHPWDHSFGACALDVPAIAHESCRNFRTRLIPSASRSPSASVLFLGGCHYPPPLHLRTGDSAPDRNLLASLLDPAFDLYVEGHAEPRSRAQLCDRLEA